MVLLVKVPSRCCGSFCKGWGDSNKGLIQTQGIYSITAATAAGQHLCTLVLAGGSGRTTQVLRIKTY